MRSDLRLAITAARDAGAILRSAFQQHLPVEYKSEDQPVTEADREADRLLQKALGTARPAYGWISEESAAESWRVANRTWLVDPLDGTANFADEVPEFSVSIGLLERGTPTLGVVYNPIADVLYHAIRGGGAHRDGARITAARGEAGQLRLVVSAAELSDGKFSDLDPSWRIIQLGSTALKMVHVAEASADAYISHGAKGLWDVCGATVIAEEAGAFVSDSLGGAIDFQDYSRVVKGVMVLAPSTGGAPPGFRGSPGE